MIDTTTLILLLSAATPILFAALGELVVERSGVLNLGVEGMMITGALAGFAAAHATGGPLAGFVAAAIAGAAVSMIFGLLTQYLLTNQVATGLALTMFGLGLTAMLGKPYEGIKAPSMPGGPLGLNPAIWVAFLLVPLVWLFLNRSRAGLVLRSIGENHDAAHGLGYKVRATRLAAIAFGGAMAGMGGAYLSLAIVPQWTEGMTAGAGWIALAIVVFAQWNPWGALLGAALFGGVSVIQLRAQIAGWAVPVHVLAMAPYLATIVVLVVISGIRRGRAGAGPASLGRNFHATR